MKIHLGFPYFLGRLLSREYDIPEFRELTVGQRKALLIPIVNSPDVQSFQQDLVWPLAFAVIFASFPLSVIPFVVELGKDGLSWLVIPTAILLLGMVFDRFSARLRTFTFTAAIVVNLLAGLRSILFGATVFLATVLVGIISLGVLLEVMTFISRFVWFRRVKKLIRAEVQKRYRPFSAYDSNGCLHPVLVLTDTVDGKEVYTLETGHGTVFRLEKGKYHFHSELVGNQVWLTDDPNAP
jgi:hypothetical protein